MAFVDKTHFSLFWYAGAQAHFIYDIFGQYKATGALFYANYVQREFAMPPFPGQCG
jgi:hypothetical protein